MAGNGLGVSVAILAGGLGTRLRPAVADRPKVLAPVHGRPYLTFLLEQLAEAAIDEVILLTGFQAERVRGTLGDNYSGMRLIYSEEPFPLGTAGALRWALPKLPASTVLVMNGDSYCDVDLLSFHHFHRHKAADTSLVLARMPGGSRFGLIRADHDGRVKRFREKIAVTRPNWINAGIYLLERRLIETIPPGRCMSLERDLFPSWVRRLRFFGFHCRGRFLDIGTPESYAQAGHFFLNTVASA